MNTYAAHDREHELLRHTKTATALLFLGAVSASYQKPETAIKRIESYWSRKGQDALLKKLTLNPMCFGQSKGAAPSANSRGVVRQIQRDAKCAIVLLPILVKEMLDARTRLEEFEMQLSVPASGLDDRSITPNVGDSLLNLVPHRLVSAAPESRVEW
ncbi:hypothetical protein ES703_32030 [subsurface metagenome]